MASVEQLMDAAELADDRYATAVVAAAHARSDYERKFALAKIEAVADGISGVSDRNDFADHAALDLRGAFLIAEASEKAAKVHVQTVLGLLIAAQAQMKHHGTQDGGDWAL